MYKHQPTRHSAFTKLALLAACVGILLPPAPLFAEGNGIIRNKGVIEKISAESERLELTVNTSRILTLETRIPRVQINNPELLSVTALSATQIQISAKKAGVTQINLWDENDKVYSIDVLIYGDARELEMALKTQFPNSSIRVFRYSNSLVLNGVVDRADHVSPIMRLAEDYSPKIINNMNVAGVQQIMLNVQVMEVSRTKLRRMGFDFRQIAGSGGFVTSAITGALTKTLTTGETFSFGVVNGSDSFTGFIDALEQNDLLKILAEPTLTTISGRPAKFVVGGEFPILVPQGTDSVSIEFKEYGTQVDFLPIVLGNGNIRLEVRPEISEIDNTRSVVTSGFVVPGLRTRKIDTAVEMKAGQTLALAGLIQERTEAQMRGLPILSNIPIFGLPFRKVEETINEIELLILVRPEYVDAMDPHEVPQGGPGMGTVSPSDKDLYFGGHLEVPRCGPSCAPTLGEQSSVGGGVMYGGPQMQMPMGTYGPANPTSAGVPVSTGTDMQYPRLPPAGFEGAQNLPPNNGARTHNPNRPPSFVRSGSVVPNAKGTIVKQASAKTDEGAPGLIGPVGYDVDGK